MPNVSVRSVRHSTPPLAEPTEKTRSQISPLSDRVVGASFGARQAVGEGADQPAQLTCRTEQVAYQARHGQSYATPDNDAYDRL